MIAPIGYDAAAGASISASSGAALVRAMMESFWRNRKHVWGQSHSGCAQWGRGALLSGCLSSANPADVAKSDRKLCSIPGGVPAAADPPDSENALLRIRTACSFSRTSCHLRAGLKHVGLSGASRDTNTRQMAGGHEESQAALVEQFELMVKGN